MHRTDDALLDHADELPLHPTIIGWLRRYLEAPPRDSDAVFAAVLTEWNAMLHRANRPAD